MENLLENSYNLRTSNYDYEKEDHSHEQFA